MLSQREGSGRCPSSGVALVVMHLAPCAPVSERPSPSAAMNLCRTRLTSADRVHPFTVYWTDP